MKLGNTRYEPWRLCKWRKTDAERRGRRCNSNNNNSNSNNNNSNNTSHSNNSNNSNNKEADGGAVVGENGDRLSAANQVSATPTSQLRGGNRRQLAYALFALVNVFTEFLFCFFFAHSFPFFYLVRFPARYSPTPLEHFLAIFLNFAPTLPGVTRSNPIKCSYCSKKNRNKWYRTSSYPVSQRKLGKPSTIASKTKSIMMNCNLGQSKTS